MIHPFTWAVNTDGQENKIYSCNIMPRKPFQVYHGQSNQEREKSMSDMNHVLSHEEREALKQDFLSSLHFASSFPVGIV
jgi:hypothetical protein